MDGDELPLIESILAAGFTPAVIALTINPDIPPPIQLRTGLVRPSQAGGPSQPSGHASGQSREQANALGEVRLNASAGSLESRLRRVLVGAEEPCDTWPCSTSPLAKLRAAGLAAPSADATFAVLHGAGYALLGFGFGRFSSWCLRCEHRMWWVRAELLDKDATSERLPDTPTAYRRMVASFWASTYGAVEGPHGFPGACLEPVHAHMGPTRALS